MLTIKTYQMAVLAGKMNAKMMIKIRMMSID
jgi:hypothetical protein